MIATRVVRNSQWTGKFHLLDGERTAFCGVEPSCVGLFKVSGDRAEFERACPERFCKRCRTKEAARA